jgi:hypothetical protein
VSDGSVSATLTLNPTGQIVEARPSWVIVTPPDYAPEISNLVTLYDVLIDGAVTRGVLQLPATTSYNKHVRPILERVLGYQWVNGQAREGFSGSSTPPFHGPGPGGHGPGGIGDFSDEFDELGNPIVDQNGNQITEAYCTHDAFQSGISTVASPTTGRFQPGTSRVTSKINRFQSANSRITVSRSGFQILKIKKIKACSFFFTR